MDYKSWIYGLDASQPQLLHTAIRVRNLDAALRFYVDGLGLTVLDRIEIDNLRLTALFLGCGIGVGSIELIHYWDADGPYSHALGYSHIAIGVPDLDAVLTRLETIAAEIASRPTVSVAGAAPAAFAKDPDGYAIELVRTRNGSIKFAALRHYRVL